MHVCICVCVCLCLERIFLSSLAAFRIFFFYINWIFIHLKNILNIIFYFVVIPISKIFVTFFCFLLLLLVLVHSAFYSYIFHDLFIAVSDALEFNLLYFFDNWVKVGFHQKKVCIWIRQILKGNKNLRPRFTLGSFRSQHIQAVASQGFTWCIHISWDVFCFCFNF